MRGNLKAIIAASVAVLMVAAIPAGAAVVKLIHTHDIAKNAVTLNRLSPGTRALIAKAAAGGANSVVGPAGAAGPAGSAGPKGADGTNGTDGAAGTNGTDGTDGLNPAVAVKASGDSGWVFSGTPTANFSGGALRLHGNFDGSTPQGAIGLVHPYNNVGLGHLTSLLYDYAIDNRPLSGDGANDAPSIHITVTGVNRHDSTTSTFDNLVYSPVYNTGGNLAGVPYSVDATKGLWYSTHPIDGQTGGQGAGAQVTLQSIANANPNAVISQISFDNGGTSGAHTTPTDAFEARVDNAVVGFDGTFTRYDFGG